MSRADQENLQRIYAMEYAVKRIKEVGLEEFEKELAWRGHTKVGIALSPEEIRKQSDAIQAFVHKTVRILAMIVLHDEFGFGHDRLERFNDRFNKKTEGLLDNYVTWDDYAKILEDECKIRNIMVDLR